MSKAEQYASPHADRKYLQKIAALEAENERLREALLTLSDVKWWRVNVDVNGE